MKKYISRYDRGVTCGVCGRKLDPSDSYSIYPSNPEKAICNDCDPDLKPQLTTEQEDLILARPKEVM